MMVARRSHHRLMASGPLRHRRDTMPDMPRTPFLANVVAVMFLLAAVTLVTLRSNYDLWAPLAAAALAGAVAAELVGLVVSRRGPVTPV